MAPSKRPPAAPKRPPPPPPPPPPLPSSSVAPASPVVVDLKTPNRKKSTSRSTKLFRRVKSIFRSFPLITTPCTMPSPSSAVNTIGSKQQVTGTLFGYRNSRVNLAIQDDPKCLPTVVLELSIQTGKLLADMGVGLVRMALECEKKATEKVRLMEEPIWTLFCNGHKAGHAVRREATDDDRKVMKVLYAVSMGAGVLPEEEGEMTYMRAYFEKVVGSKDSETYHMLNPDGNSGPELSIFFVRL